MWCMSSQFAVKIGDRAYQRIGRVAKQPQTGVAVTTKPSSKPPGDVVMIDAQGLLFSAERAQPVFGPGAKGFHVERRVPLDKGALVERGNAYLNSVTGLIPEVLFAASRCLLIALLAVGNTVGIARFVALLAVHTAPYRTAPVWSSR